MPNTSILFGDPAGILDEHTPSLTDEDEDEIRERALGLGLLMEGGSYEGDLARRTCACGVKIDGFYEYVDHLKEVFRAAQG